MTAQVMMSHAYSQFYSQLGKQALRLLDATKLNLEILKE